MTPSAEKHLAILQGVINRLAGNSFMIKTWSVTLVSALFVLSQKDAKPSYIAIAYFPAIAFWLLDGYYLSRERAFRALFNSVRRALSSESDLSMSCKTHLKGRNTWGAALFSPTLLLFHGGVVGTILFAMLFIVKT